MKAAGYMRVSTDEQVKEGVSLGNQEQKIRLFCQAKDWDLIEIYRDEGKSGKDLKRDNMQRLMAEVQLQRFDVVVVYKVDRLSRRQRDLWYLLDDVFEPHGVGFVSVNESFDTTSAVGKACLGMIGVFAQLERDLISERTKDALAFKKSKGETLGGPALGFTLTGETKADELAVINYAKRLKQDGLSLGNIAGRFNAEQLPTKRGGKWYKGTIRYLLNNLIYASV